jgi:ribonucleoside-diphosphate reductase alpha chain
MEEKINKVYSKQEVEKATLEYFENDNLAANVWVDKYAYKSSNGAIYELNPNLMHRRLAKEFARIENNYKNPLTEDEIYELFKGFKYIVPQGRVMAGLGVLESYRSLSNCLVLPTPKDSYSSIMYTDTMLVNAAKRGSGFGVDLSNLRPKGNHVKNAANTSTGIVPFMERFSNSTREVGQDNRRGACLLGLNISHPQSLEFAKSKTDRTKITGANISLKIDDKFLNAVENNSSYNLEFNDKIYETIDAKDHWKKIINIVRDDSEPGIFFWDRIVNYDPVSAYPNHQITLTNACGEQPMGALDTCRLITVNLYSFVDFPFTSDAKFNKEIFIKMIKKQIKLGDDLVDLEIEYVDRILNKIKNDAEPENEKIIEISLWEGVKEKAIRGRRIGCGVTGLGDMLAALNLKYGSDESLIFVEEIMKLKLKSELEETILLSKERGSFPDYDFNLEYPNNLPYNDFYKFLLEEFNDEVQEMKKYGRRNINWNTIAPVGTTSLLTKTTSGCEPTFNPYYNRRKKTDNVSESAFKDKNGDLWKEYKVFHSKFVEWFKITSGNRFTNSGAINYLENLNDIELNDLIKQSPYFQSTANEIDWGNRVKMQGILQKYTTSAISSTVNLPENITVDEVEKIYLEAWKNKCKGITIYREGSRDGILINEKKEIKVQEELFHENHAAKRPKKLKAEIYKFQNNLEKWVAIVGLLGDKRPYEIFTGEISNGLINFPLTSSKDYFIVKNIIEDENGEKKKRYDIEYTDSDGNKQTYIGINQAFNPEFWNYAKLISSILRHSVPLVKVYELIYSLNFKENHINTWRNGVARVIKRYINNGEKTKGLCGHCGAENSLEFKEGCVTCNSCGTSKCS